MSPLRKLTEEEAREIQAEVVEPYEQVFREYKEQGLKEAVFEIQAGKNWRAESRKLRSAAARAGVSYDIIKRFSPSVFALGLKYKAEPKVEPKAETE